MPSSLANALSASTLVCAGLFTAPALADVPSPPPDAQGSPSASSIALPPGPADPLANAPARNDPPRSAGYHNGIFYIHSPDDVFRLYILGRVHADYLNQFGPGTSSTTPGNGIVNGFYLRRARLELGGEFFQAWQWQVGAEFSSATSVDNSAATQFTPTGTACATPGSAACVDRENSVENPTVKAIPTDVFVNFGPSPWANVQVGQFYLPFTLENRISDNTTPFLERSLAVRNLGAPLQRDVGAMFWGESPDRMIYYAAALVDGDGPNRPNVDTRFDGAGRVVVRPAALATSSPTRWSQVGVSWKVGSRDPSAVGYDLPSMTTQGGFPFWKPTYADSLKRTTHILPSSSQWGLAADAFVPIENFDLTGEFVYNSYDTREAIDGYQLSPYTERLGELKGCGWYAQVGYWIVGDRDIIGYPSYGRPIHVDFSKPQLAAQHGLQVLAKFEQLSLTYDGASRGGKVDAKTPNGDIKVDAVEFGVNYWATKHLRVSANYSLYIFPDAAPTAQPSGVTGPLQSGGQRAVSPGQALPVGVDGVARNTSTTLNEVQLRVGVQF